MFFTKFKVNVTNLAIWTTFFFATPFCWGNTSRISTDDWLPSSRIILYVVDAINWSGAEPSLWNGAERNSF